MYFVYEILLLYFFPDISLLFLVGFSAILGILLFENSHENNFFGPFLESSRVFFLSSVLLFATILMGLIFVEFNAIYFLIPIMVFLFSVHVRFSNIISYIGGLILLYFVYAFVFISLVSVVSIFTTLLFIFLFPTLLIANTYFWDQKEPHDYYILHYSSIAFSIVFFLYSGIFVFAESGNTLVFTAFSVFLLALQFSLSYFRFRS